MIRELVSAAALASGLAFTSAAQAQAPVPACDVACMTDVANRFMDAMTRSDPQTLPWADRVGYAENSTKLRIGEGSWVTIKGRSKTPLVVADPQTGHVVWTGAIDDHGQAGFYAMDMKLRRGRIASVQSVIRRKEGRPPFGDPVTYAPDRTFTTDVALPAPECSPEAVSSSGACPITNTGLFGSARSER